MGKEWWVYGGTGDPNLLPPVHICIPGCCPCFLSFLLLALNVRYCSIIPCMSHAYYPFTTPTSHSFLRHLWPSIFSGLPPPSSPQWQKDSRWTRPYSLPVLASNHYPKLIKPPLKKRTYTVPGARFSKVPIINGPGKLSPFTLKIEVSIVLHLTW